MYVLASRSLSYNISNEVSATDFPNKVSSITGVPE